MGLGPNTFTPSIPPTSLAGMLAQTTSSAAFALNPRLARPSVSPNAPGHSVESTGSSTTTTNTTTTTTAIPRNLFNTQTAGPAASTQHRAPTVPLIQQHAPAVQSVASLCALLPSVLTSHLQTAGADPYLDQAMTEETTLLLDEMAQRCAGLSAALRTRQQDHHSYPQQAAAIAGVDPRTALQMSLMDGIGLGQQLAYYLSSDI